MLQLMMLNSILFLQVQKQSYQLAASNTFRIASKTDNSAVANTDYIAYDATIAANDTITLTLGVTLQAGAEISVGASDANVTFQAYGTEIT